MQDILHLHASYLESSARCFKSRRAASKRRSRGAARDVADLSLAASSNNKGRQARQGKARQGKARQGKTCDLLCAKAIVFEAELIPHIPVLTRHHQEVDVCPKG